jgi:hypothetical protein
VALRRRSHGEQQNNSAMAIGVHSLQILWENGYVFEVPHCWESPRNRILGDADVLSVIFRRFLSTMSSCIEAGQNKGCIGRCGNFWQEPGLVYPAALSAVWG